MNHSAYGGNSFTFLLFGAIAAAEDKTRREALELLISRLKPIITPLHDLRIEPGYAAVDVSVLREARQLLEQGKRIDASAALDGRAT